MASWRWWVFTAKILTWVDDSPASFTFLLGPMLLAVSVPPVVVMVVTFLHFSSGGSGVCGCGGVCSGAVLVLRLGVKVRCAVWIRA